jgi:hypothetical protein
MGGLRRHCCPMYPLVVCRSLAVLGGEGEPRASVVPQRGNFLCSPPPRSWPCRLALPSGGREYARRRAASNRRAECTVLTESLSGQPRTGSSGVVGQAKRRGDCCPLHLEAVRRGKRRFATTPSLSTSRSRTAVRSCACPAAPSAEVTAVSCCRRCHTRCRGSPRRGEAGGESEVQ